MNESTIQLLNKLIKKVGLIQAATLLNHESTSRIERWKREGEIPQRLEAAVRIQLINVFERGES